MQDLAVLDHHLESEMERCTKHMDWGNLDGGSNENDFQDTVSFVGKGYVLVRYPLE
jgi:hypothetical protein